MLGLVCVDILILLLWTFLDRPRGISYLSSAGGLYEPILYTVCSTNLNSPFERAMVAWKAILLGAGVYKSICTWDMPSDLAEVNQISLSSAFHVYTTSVTHSISVLPLYCIPYLHYLCNAFHTYTTTYVLHLLNLKHHALNRYAFMCTIMLMNLLLVTSDFTLHYYILNSNNY